MAEAHQTNIQYFEDIETLHEQRGFTQLSTKRNAVDYLNKTHRFILEIYEDKLAIKWVAIALHGALYCYAACKAASIHGHNETTAVRKKDGTHYAKGPWELLDLCALGDFYNERKWHIEFVVSTIRNNTQHPIPSAGMKINNSALLGSFGVVLDVIMVLIESCAWFNAEAYRNYRREAIGYIEQSKKELGARMVSTS